MGTKQFMNLNEQLEILKSRGLIVNDEEKAKVILFRENYFFLSGYRHVFLRSSLDRVFVGFLSENVWMFLTFFKKCSIIYTERLWGGDSVADMVTPDNIGEGHQTARYAPA